MWNGVFAKHRDYLHSHDPIGHMLAHGGSLSVGNQTILQTNPISETDYDVPKRFYAVDLFEPETKTTYRFFVEPGPVDGQPTVDEIKEKFLEYVQNPVPDGRDWREPVDWVESFRRGLWTASDITPDLAAWFLANLPLWERQEIESLTNIDLRERSGPGLDSLI